MLIIYEEKNAKNQQYHHEQEQDKCAIDKKFNCLCEAKHEQ